MVTRAVIKAAARAARAPATAVPSLGSGVSPLMASYNNWGGPLSYGQHLPRPATDFATGGFSPLTPIAPMGVDQPSPGEDRPEPRRFQYPVAWNLIHQPGTEGLGKLADFSTLRLLADYSSIARACIQLRKAEIRSLAWDIIPTKNASKDMRGDKDAHSDFAKRKAEAMKFLHRPDPDRFQDFSSWLDAVLEDIFVIDALSIYLQPTRGRGKGLLGSDLGALVLVDGASIRPLLDLHGGTPRPPSPAYQQYLYGAPRSDLMTLINGSDLEEMDDPAAEYRADQLLYLPMSPRGWTPYGQAPAERCIVPILASLARQKWQADFYQEGTVPSVFVAPGDVAMTPNQIAELQLALNGIAGDPAWKHKIIVLPGGSRVDPMHATELADQFDEVIAVQVCMGYDVMPMELGISPKVSMTQSVGAANQMAKASQQTNDRKSLKPLLLFLKVSIFDVVLQEICGQPDMEFMWEGLEEGEDEESKVNILTQMVNNGLMSHDEARLELGKDPWGLPITADPGVMLGGGFVPLGAIDPATGMPAGKQPTLPEEAAEIPVGGEGWVESQGAGAAAVKPQPGGVPPAHAGAQAAMDEHDRQGPTQVIKPSGAKHAADHLVKSKWASPDDPSTGGAATSAVRDQLADDFPKESLGWIGRASWNGPVHVPINRIDLSNKQNWQAAHEPAKVNRFKDKITSKLNRGKPIKPVVLVKTPNNSKFIVIDGHHRTMAYQQLGLPVIAWIGKVTSETGPWDNFHNRQLPQDDRSTTDDDTRQSVGAAGAADKAARSELEALGRHLRKGRDVATWQRRHLSGSTLASLAGALERGLAIDQAVEVAKSTIQPSSKLLDRPRRVAWEGWNHDQLLVQLFADRLRTALARGMTESVAHQVASDWLVVAVPGKDAKAWLQLTYPQLAIDAKEAIGRVLRQVWRRGWALGEYSARSQLASAPPVASKSVGDESDNANDTNAADAADISTAVVDEPTLRDWLDRAGIDSIDSISDTRMSDLADSLTSALNEGWSVDRLAEDISGFTIDEASANLVSVTELARAMSQGALTAYDNAGVTEVAWIAVPGACQYCLNNESAGNIPIGSSFPSGGTAPPAHPMCRCSLEPASISGIDIAGMAAEVMG